MLLETIRNDNIHSYKLSEDFFYLHSGGWKQGPPDTAAT
jgi:hypothetical protein